jgi:hypothetical protein
MKTLPTILILILGITIFSCKQSQTPQEKIDLQDTLSQTATNTESLQEIIAGLFERASTSDTLEFNNQFKSETNKDFLFFKSGNIINKTEKNALVVVCPTDTTFTVRMYSLQNNKWILLDSIEKLDAFPTQFYANFQDYNFDGQTDLYINVTASNGWPLARGHLIIIDPTSKKLLLHRETRDFANMTPDPKSKTVQTELWNGYDLHGNQQLTVFSNKWVNGKLKTISKKETTIKTSK